MFRSSARFFRIPQDASAHAARPDSGFSLLEVLVALAVLAILGTVTVRGVHENQSTLSEDRWKDTATLMARNLLYTQALEGGEAASGGSFAPEYPAMRWEREVRELGGAEGSRSVVVVRQEQGSRTYDIRLETFDALWSASGKDRAAGAGK